MSHKTGGLCEDESFHSTLVTHANREEYELRTLTRRHSSQSTDRCIASHPRPQHRPTYHHRHRDTAYKGQGYCQRDELRPKRRSVRLPGMEGRDTAHVETRGNCDAIGRRRRRRRMGWHSDCGHRRCPCVRLGHCAHAVASRAGARRHLAMSPA